MIQSAARDVEERRQILAGRDDHPVRSPKWDIECEIQSGEVAIGAGDIELSPVPDESYRARDPFTGFIHADACAGTVKRRNLEAAAGSNVEVAHNLWTMTASDLRHAEDHMLLLGRKTAMEKVATFLLEMDRRLAKTGMMALPMCRRDIGDYLGLTLETVSRALSQLSDQGILVFSSARQIVLRNRQRLADMDA